MKGRLWDEFRCRRIFGFNFIIIFYSSIVHWLILIFFIFLFANFFLFFIGHLFENTHVSIFFI